MNPRAAIILNVLCFVLGCGVTWLITTHVLVGVSDSSANEEQIRTGGYTLINPLLDCEEGDPALNEKEFGSLKRSLEDRIELEKEVGSVSDVSVYFRDLNNGPTMGINSEEDFSPASLLKLPVMMAYYKAAQNSPSILDAKIPFNGSSIELQQVFSDSTLEKGKSYTINDLIERMIEKSDNGALNVLENHIDGNLIDNVSRDLDITVPNSSTAEDFISVKQYAALFRVLYNASYLNREYSQKALSVLTKSEFKHGLVAGIPAGVPIAHKYGERELATGVKQLHNCGIVYYPNNPYLVCIMTRGDNVGKLANVISTISGEIYKAVDARFKK